MPTSEIPGVNMNVRHELYSGYADIFLFALESFVANSPASLDALRNVTNENLPRYAIDVHALKSMAAAIGADELRERARKLEDMAKDGDLQAVLAENDELFERTETLVNNIKNWLDSSDKKN